MQAIDKVKKMLQSHGVHDIENVKFDNQQYPYYILAIRYHDISDRVYGYFANQKMVNELVKNQLQPMGRNPYHYIYILDVKKNAEVFPTI